MMRNPHTQSFEELRDKLAADAHEAWVIETRRNGIESRLSSITGEEQMVPFAELSPPVQAYDYILVDTVLANIRKHGWKVVRDGNTE